MLRSNMTVIFFTIQAKVELFIWPLFKKEFHRSAKGIKLFNDDANIKSLMILKYDLNHFNY